MAQVTRRDRSRSPSRKPPPPYRGQREISGKVDRTAKPCFRGVREISGMSSEQTHSWEAADD
jgi:hypothetical protein